MPRSVSPSQPFHCGMRVPRQPYALRVGLLRSVELRLPRLTQGKDPTKANIFVLEKTSS